MTALIVRSEPGASAFVRRLARAGLPALACPVTSIRALDTPFTVPASAQAVAFTSVSAVRCYAGRGERTDLPAFAVGAATAQAARDAGFAAVHSAGSDVHGLARLIAARCRPAQGELVWPAARDVAGNLAKSLDSLGYTVMRAALYEARAAAVLPAAAANALHTRTATSAALFSVRNALEFVRLSLAGGHEDAVADLSVCCLSPPVAAAFAADGALPAGRVAVAPSPDADAMAALIASLPGG